MTVIKTPTMITTARSGVRPVYNNATSMVAADATQEGECVSKQIPSGAQDTVAKSSPCQTSHLTASDPASHSDQSDHEDNSGYTCNNIAGTSTISSPDSFTLYGHATICIDGRHYNCEQFTVKEYVYQNAEWDYCSTFWCYPCAMVWRLNDGLWHPLPALRAHCRFCHAITFQTYNDQASGFLNEQLYFFHLYMNSKSYVNWLPDEMLEDVAGLCSQEQIFMGSPFSDTYGPRPSLVIRSIYSKTVRRIARCNRESPETVFAQHWPDLTQDGDVESNPGPKLEIPVHECKLRKHKLGMNCFCHIQRELDFTEWDEPIFVWTTCTMRVVAPYQFIVVTPFSFIASPLSLHDCYTCRKHLKSELKTLKFFFKNTPSKSWDAPALQSVWTDAALRGHWRRDLQADGDVESNPGPPPAFHMGAVKKHLEKHFNYIKHEWVIQLHASARNEPTGVHCCVNGPGGSDGKMVPHVPRPDCPPDAKLMSFECTAAWLDHFYPKEKLQELFPNADQLESDDQSLQSLDDVNPRIRNKRMRGEKKRKRGKVFIPSLPAQTSEPGLTKEDYMRQTLTSCPRDFRMLLSMREEIHLGSGPLDSFSLMAKPEWTDFWEKIDATLWPTGPKRLVIGWRGFYDSGSTEVVACLAGRDHLGKMAPYSGSKVPCDFVVGPLPYSNNLGFFMDECWTSEHYRALAQSGYGPLHMSGELCVYKRGERFYQVPERYNIYLAPRTSMLKMIWVNGDHVQVPILIDSEAPFVFTNGVWMHDGSYVTANRQLAALGFTYSKHWSWLVQGTCLYQSLRNNAHNIQKLNVYAADSHFQNIFNSWFATSNVADAVWKTLFQERDAFGTHNNAGLNNTTRQSDLPPAPPSHDDLPEIQLRDTINNIIQRINQQFTSPPPIKPREASGNRCTTTPQQSASLPSQREASSMAETTQDDDTALDITLEFSDDESSEEIIEDENGTYPIVTQTDSESAATLKDQVIGVTQFVKHNLRWELEKIKFGLKKEAEVCTDALTHGPQTLAALDPTEVTDAQYHDMSAFRASVWDVGGNPFLRFMVGSYLWFNRINQDQWVAMSILHDRDYIDSPGPRWELEHSTCSSMGVQVLHGPPHRQGLPILRQAAKAAFVDGTEWPFPSMPPYDEERLQILFEPGHNWFTSAITKARPEVLYHTYFGDLYVPNPQSNLWTLAYRMGKTGLTPSKGAQHRYRQFWKERQHGWKRDVDWRDDGAETTTFANFLDTLAEMPKSKSRRHLEWAGEYMMGLHRWHATPYRIFAKLDEVTYLEGTDADTLTIADFEGICINGKSRHLLSVSPHDMFYEQGNLKDIKSELKRELFGLPEPFIFPLTTEAGEFVTNLMLTYGADMDNQQVSHWYTHARSNEGVHVLVGGDDNATVLNFRGVYIEIEGDVSMCDQSHSELHRDLFLDVCRLNGMSPKVVQSMKDNYTSLAVFYKGNERVAMVLMLDSQLKTGSTKTSFANTVTVGQVIVYIMQKLVYQIEHYLPSETEIANLFKEEAALIGMKMKVKVWIRPHIPRITYHKMYFVWSRKANIYTACPLPGSTIKKMLKVRAPTLCSRERYLQLLSDGARSRWPCSQNPICRVLMERLQYWKGTFGFDLYKQIRDDEDLWLNTVGDGAELAHWEYMEVVYGIGKEEIDELMTWAVHLDINVAQDLSQSRLGELLNKLWVGEQW